MMVSHATPRASNGYFGIAPKRMNGVASVAARSQAHTYAEVAAIKRKALRYFDENYKRIFGYRAESNKAICREKLSLMFIDIGLAACEQLTEKLELSPDELMATLVGKLAWK